MAVMDLKPPSWKQLFLIGWWTMDRYKNKTAIIGDGSVRTGKTFWMGQGFVYWSMTEFDETNFLMAGKTIQSLERNVISPLISLLTERGYRIKYLKQEKKMTISYGGHTNYYYLFGGKDESSQDLVQGITVAGCYFDEVAIQAESFVNQATLRALTYPNRKYWFNCNPKGPYHWFKKQWIDDLGRQNAIRIKFNMHDNPILSDEDIENIKGRYQGMFRKRYIDGDWVMAEGLVYSNFNKKTMIHDYPPINEITNYYVSCDFGAQNPTAFLLWGNYNNTWPCLKQYYYDGRHEQHDKSITEYANDLDTFLGDLARKTPIILDPSAKAFAIELEQRGYTVIPANNDVLDGIREVQNAMNNGLIWYTPNLPDFFREKTSYAWNTKLAEKGIDKVIKKHDHLQDAERYFVMFLVTVLLDRQDEDGGIQFGMR